MPSSPSAAVPSPLMAVFAVEDECLEEDVYEDVDEDDRELPLC